MDTCWNCGRETSRADQFRFECGAFYCPECIEEAEPCWADCDGCNFNLWDPCRDQHRAKPERI